MMLSKEVQYLLDEFDYAAQAWGDLRGYNGSYIYNNARVDYLAAKDKLIAKLIELEEDAGDGGIRVN